MEKAVLYQKKEAVAWITLNRPQSLNSMNDILVEELHAALDEAAADEGIRSIVITGAGKAFCAGGDLTYLETLESVTAKKAFIEKVGLLARKITKLPKAVIAMVNGVAAGAGANLMPGLRKASSRSDLFRTAAACTFYLKPSASIKLRN